MSISGACRLFDVSRQSLYAAGVRYRKRMEQMETVRRIVLGVRMRMPRLGTRKLYHLIEPELAEVGIKMGRDALFAYLRTQGMLVKPRRSYRKTTLSTHWLRKHANLMAGMTPERPEQAFVSDITYVRSGEGVHYLSLVTDAYSRRIMGYSLSDDLGTPGVLKALKMAVGQRVSSAPLIHHSDRGMQYCSEIYQTTLAKAGIVPSMTDGYDCYQNALAERVNGIIKNEFLVRKCPTRDALAQSIKEVVEIYNGERPHLSLGMRTPNEVHEEARGENPTGLA